MRAMCNPEPDSWLSRLISWWWDAKTGYAIPERSGVLRYFIRLGDRIEWADSRGGTHSHGPGTNGHKEFHFYQVIRL